MVDRVPGLPRFLWQPLAATAARVQFQLTAHVRLIRYDLRQLLRLVLRGAIGGLFRRRGQARLPQNLDLGLLWVAKEQRDRGVDTQKNVG